MGQTVLIIIFVVNFVIALGVLCTWRRADYYELSSFEKRYPPPTGRCRKLQLARNRRIKTRRQRNRCRLGNQRHKG
jgi:hypothetical protein